MSGWLNAFRIAKVQEGNCLGTEIFFQLSMPHEVNLRVKPIYSKEKRQVSILIA